MPQPLTRAYLQDHTSGGQLTSPGRSEPASSEEFADMLLDHILIDAHRRFTTDTEERDEIQLTLPVTVRSVDTMQPQGGCIEFCIGIGLAQICYHRDFKGKRPGKG